MKINNKRNFEESQETDNVPIDLKDEIQKIKVLNEIEWAELTLEEKKEKISKMNYDEKISCPGYDYSIIVPAGDKEGLINLLQKALNKEIFCKDYSSESKEFIFYDSFVDYNQILLAYSFELKKILKDPLGEILISIMLKKVNFDKSFFKSEVFRFCNVLLDMDSESDDSDEE